MEVLIPTPRKRCASNAKVRVTEFCNALALTSRLCKRLLIVACILFCPVHQTNAQSEPLGEYQVKAAFLFAFTKFVDWPPEASSNPSAPIVLGIVGEDPFGKLLTDITDGKTVNGRKVVVRRLREGQNLRSCQILFISSSEKKRLAQILGELKETNALTVSEIHGFPEAGGMINFILDNNKVKLEINLDAATRAHLKISAKMLAVAHIVGDEQHGGKS